MVNINWCKTQKKGIKFIEPNDNLSKEYLNNAEETLNVLKDLKNKSNMWLATTKYYFEYFCAYSILMKLGIKCEIHDCTIALVKFLEDFDVFKKNTYKILEKDKELRIDNQYYLKNKKVFINYEELNNIFLKTKELINIIPIDKINNIRYKIKNVK